jgi:hypothetical protein
MLEEAEALELIHCVVSFTRPRKPTFLLCDHRKATGVSAEARRLISSKQHTREFEGYIAIFGASSPVRILTNLIFKAAALTLPFELHMGSFSLEPEARAWLAAHKQEVFRREEETMAQGTVS